MTRKYVKPLMTLVAACATTFCAGARAETGKLLLTGGVSSIDGAAGGGLTPWAVIGSNATDGEVGASAFLTRVGTQDYGLAIYGAAVGIQDKYELSIAQQDFNTRDNVAALGFAGLHLKQTILGAKVRVLGDAVLDSDTLVPQVAVGVQYKTLLSSGAAADFVPVLESLGAKKSGTDFYVSATKLLLGQSLLLNATLRATKANQNGLLGFGSANKNNYSLQPEFSAAYLISKNVAVGAEYRFMRNQLNTTPLGDGLRASDWKDLFVAWAPSKNFSLTLAYVDLGVIVPATTASRKQTGYYVSAQLAF